MSIYDKDCEEGCRLLKAERDKIKAINDWIKTDPVSYSKRGSITKSCLEEWKAEGIKILEAEG